VLSLRAAFSSRGGAGGPRPVTDALPFDEPFALLLNLHCKSGVARVMILVERNARGAERRRDAIVSRDFGVITYGSAPGFLPTNGNFFANLF
jgi:hypothetical protein